MVDTAGLNLAHDKKNTKSIYNRKPSVLKTTRPGKKRCVGVTKKKERYRACGVLQVCGDTTKSTDVVEVRTWSCNRMGGIVRVRATTRAVRAQVGQ
jgi:hypothetical protein